MSPKLVLDFLWKHKASICPEGVILQHFKLSTSKTQPLTSFLHGYHCSGTMSALAVNSLLRCQIVSILSLASVPFPFHCYQLFQALPLPFSLVDCGSLLTGLSLVSALPFVSVSPRATHESTLLTHGCDDTSLFKCLQWLLLVNTFIFPAWHSRPLSFGTKCSPAFFPTWCLYGSVPSRLGSLPCLK